MKADPETEAAVLDVLDKFSDYYYQRDFENLWQLFAQDPDIVVIGTGEHENSCRARRYRALISPGLLADILDLSGAEVGWSGIGGRRRGLGGERVARRLECR